LSAQDQATWTPSSPNPGDTLVITYDPSIGQLPAASDTIKLHWGINQKGPGNWHQPPQIMWPPKTKPMADGKAVQTPMNKQGDGKWQVQIVTLDTIKTLHFVFTNGTLWDNNNSANWDIYLGGGGGVIHKDWVTLSVVVDLGPAVQNRGFTYGDTVEVRAGAYGTASEVYKIALKRQKVSSIYKGFGDVLTTRGDTLDYSYFAKKNGKDNWEVFYNFTYQGVTQSEAQYRQIPVTAAVITALDTVRSKSIDPHRPPFFRNKSVVARNLTVTLACDVRPAYYHLKMGGAPLMDIQGKINVSDPDSVLILGVAINGPITGSWSNPLGTDWGSHLMTLDNKRMVDDGTHGDVAAGDSVFSIQFHFFKDTGDVVGQEFKFGLGGGDNEGGYGNNHVENLDDFQEESILDAQFGSIDPYFYSEWDYSKKSVKPTGVESARTGMPAGISLYQNYPNPFNPVTSIQYNLSSVEKATVAVYNLRGERIAVLVDNQKLSAGAHVALWDGTNFRSKPVGSGVYLIRLEAGGVVQTKKMLLVR
jgi:hypothetical protein